MKRDGQKPQVIVAAYDTETTNIAGFSGVSAFPVLHQLGIKSSIDLAKITPENVESQVQVSCYRHASEAWAAFDGIIANGKEARYVPIIMVHNLGFDMYSLSPYLNRFTCDVCAKSSTKPITITCNDENGEPILKFWDTLSFTQKSLKTMGEECGYSKKTGDWDYDLVRTPETPLTADELGYAKADIYALFAYMGYYLRLNPLIEETMLGVRAITKTGAVRIKRELLFSKLQGKKKTCGQYWHSLNRSQVPQTDDELYTMHAATRGGFTFCASKHAGIAYNLPDDMRIFGFDAASQHPAQMTSHQYPVDFREATPQELDAALQIVECVSVDDVLARWEEPFMCAFNAKIHFENLRPKAGSVWEENGIYPLASARLSSIPYATEDNAGGAAFDESKRAKGYKDTAINPVCEFGKLVSADSCDLYLTELGYWEVCQCYDFDSAQAVAGYATVKFARPSDYSILSVMYFYKAKSVFKRFMKDHVATDDVRVIAPEYLVNAMCNGTADDNEVHAYYQTLKSDLNALYGIEVTNEAKPNQRIDPLQGIVTEESRGLEDLTGKPKTWYQFGQRVVGWSRIAQIINILLISPHALAVVNGDTDSVKCLAETSELPAIEAGLQAFGDAVERARGVVCARVQKQYPEQYTDLHGMGLYEYEFQASQYLSAWNKSYVIRENGTYKFTLAGVPTSRGEQSYNRFAEALERENGWGFERVACEMLGYNATVDPNITLLNGRKKPPWGLMCNIDVTDYLGNTSHVSEPMALALYPEAKTIGDTHARDNATCARIALENNPKTKTWPRLLLWHDGKPRIEET